ncbi:glutathione synthase/RimK-type ligase-like ATP-grasp enzyme [Paenibacillus forsythiae]|uniref:Glutathione synthase/RimK-type ligase-like ATP-grasp enzyme n=1 Tax=Paenibacillus forsythiae TaxID=365616 RepID=A0ABU3H316_9BACL|nr:YheC/YheD family protein [Paenibacillus forsythiae]MDT3425213.1 glutathione synthase/RimK-type ligase-like ATP-grasp enzyme [Paenibacillus forsythiae]
MRIQRVPSKWAKTEVILLNRTLTPYIPDTRKYDSAALSEMLGLHETVYIKPDRGTYGSGVMRAERRSLNLTPSGMEKSVEHMEKEESRPASIMYILRYGTKAQAYRSIEELHQAIYERTKGRLYLIQKGISLLNHKRRPFDLRVLVQKNPGGRWETTGLLGRVAAPQKIVTNYHNGGRVLTAESLLGEHMNPNERLATISHLKNLGVDTGRQLETAFPGMKEIGLDVAIDDHHDLWILEVNTLPSLIAFKMFEDKSIYRKIRRYATAYGRAGFGKTGLSSSRKA